MQTEPHKENHLGHVVTCCSCAHELVKHCGALESDHEDFTFYHRSGSCGIEGCDCGCDSCYDAFHYPDLQDQYANDIHEQSAQFHHTHSTSSQTHHVDHDLRGYLSSILHRTATQN
uniref:Uncharacterized protein n=1 Tax=Oryza glumipatula TaxID=40148 RepID=A0A0D9YZH0_9ORYZ